MSHIPLLTYCGEYYGTINSILNLCDDPNVVNLFLTKQNYPQNPKVLTITDDFDLPNKVKQSSVTTYQNFPPASLYGYDLIFVDTPRNIDKKVKTIKYLTRELLKAKIVITGTENRDIRHSINKLYYTYTFKYDEPIHYTLCDKNVISTQLFRRANNAIKKYKERFQEDYVKWRPLLRSKTVSKEQYVASRQYT